MLGGNWHRLYYGLSFPNYCGFPQRVWVVCSFHRGLFLWLGKFILETFTYLDTLIRIVSTSTHLRNSYLLPFLPASFNCYTHLFPFFSGGSWCGLHSVTCFLQVGLIFRSDCKWLLVRRSTISSIFVNREMAVASATMASGVPAPSAPPAPGMTDEMEADHRMDGGVLVENTDRVEEEIPSPAPTPAMPVSGPSARPKSPIVHGSYEKADSDEEEVMVKTEFVWADGAEHDVKLSGAWNGWMPVQMYHEGGKFTTWHPSNRQSAFALVVNQFYIYFVESTIVHPSNYFAYMYVFLHSPFFIFVRSLL